MAKRMPTAPGTGSRNGSAPTEPGRAAEVVRLARLRQDAAGRAADFALEASKKAEQLRERLEHLGRRNTYCRVLAALAAHSVEPRDRQSLLTEVLDASIAH